MNASKNVIKSISIFIFLNLKNMFTKQLIGIMTVVLIALFSNDILAQGHPDVELNVNPDLGTCDFELSPNLNQQEWNRFTKEIGSIMYFKPMASAKPLGKMKFDITLDYSSTSIDQTSGAWNNTFYHPDSTHYLGERINLPGLHARMGLTDKIDIGIYYTSAAPFGAPYSFLGGEVKYAFLNNTDNGWAAAVRGSFIHDLTIKDFNLSTIGVDGLVSKSFGNFTPYLGLVGTISHTREFSDRVDLANVTKYDTRALVGAEYKWKFINVGAEADFATLNTYSIKLGVSF